MSNILHFPENFTWGAATSSYQIEGAHNLDGKGPSIWDAFCAIPGKVHKGQTGNIACDHYHRMEEDVFLMKQMGLKAYRFSISWPRILPTGRGKVNRQGIEFYSKLIDLLLKNGIQPWVTLYHWDLPLALQFEEDGWLGHSIADAFAKYADVCFEHFGDRVKNWITINEAWVVAMLGYGQGVFAPGRTSNSEPYLAGHNLLRAHARAVQVYREKYQSSQRGRIGMSNNCDWREPLTGSPADLETPRLRLEPLSVGHAAEMVAVLGDPSLYRFTGGEPPSLETLEGRYRSQVSGSGDPNELWLNWIVRRKDTGAPTGFVQATVLLDDGPSADIAWVIGVGDQGKGFATEAARAMAEGLLARGVATLTAHIHPDHRASQAVARAVGLVETAEVDERVELLDRRQAPVAEASEVLGVERGGPGLSLGPGELVLRGLENTVPVGVGIDDAGTSDRLVDVRQTVTIAIVHSRDFQISDGGDEKGPPAGWGGKSHIAE